MSKNPPSPEFYAHTLEGAPKENWEPLFTPWHDRPGHDLSSDPSVACSGKNGSDCPHCKNLEPSHGHLNKVAYLCAQFAAQMLPAGADRDSLRLWGYITGLWHDLGKFSIEFQDYLSKASDIHCDEILERIDHTTAGAKLAVSKSPQPFGHCIATAIAGHHAGLLDALSNGACLHARLRKEVCDVSKAHQNITHEPLPSKPDIITPSSSPFSVAFFQRMIFSSLVDADFLATEAFMSTKQAKLRPQKNSTLFSKALNLLENKIQSFGIPAPSDKVNTARSSVFQDCLNTAKNPQGLYSLTVPTGGGKTLSSLAFALKHAIKHGHKRIIYVIPFTSIIEQNASVFEDLLSPLGDNIILEHHSNLSPDKETTRSRLAAENWDAPIIVTTSVQFYESLFAAKTSKNRKLHNIANSVVILDEAQALPVQYINPTLRALEELSKNYHTSIVFCTATQPAIGKTTEFDIGLENIHEITTNTNALFSSLKRVNVTYRGSLDDQTIADELANQDQALCIVNIRNHAQSLYQLLPPSEENYHLSALMCPEHRMATLRTVRTRLDDELPTRLISTQLIEAGVDIDFPVVYRSMAGLDSIAQAAGRCNREGKIEVGQIHIFHSEHVRSETYFQETANVGHEILDLHKDDPLSTDAVKAYFDKYYYLQKTKWDAYDILGDFTFATHDQKLPFLFQYKTTADKFKLIQNQQIPIIIPWDDDAEKLCENLRNEAIPINRQLLRSLQRYTVQIYSTQFYKNEHQFEEVRDGDFHILICPETHYSDTFGLNLTDEAANSSTLICGS